MGVCDGVKLPKFMYREMISQIWDGVTGVVDWAAVSAVAATFAALAAWRTASITKQALQDELIPTLQPLSTGARLAKASPTVELAIRNIGRGAAKDVYVLFDDAILDGNFSIAADRELRLHVPASGKREAHEAVRKLLDSRSTGVWWTVRYKDIHERNFETSFYLYRHKDLSEDYFAVDRGLWRFRRVSADLLFGPRMPKVRGWRNVLN